MLIRTAVITSIALLDISIIAAGAHAAPASPQPTVAATGLSDIQLINAQRQRVRRLTTTATPGSGPCGVWRCTWPTSGGGCLVWEKTKCKVINPFD